MATAPTIPTVPVDDYLNTGYHPDVEYVDGVLVERGMPTPAHGALQLIVGAFLSRYAEEFSFEVLTECRVEIVKRSRYRIPDILLCTSPIPRTKTLETVPLAVIEILSPDDRTSDQLVRFRDYRARGVRDIVVLDPENLTAARYPHMEDPVTGIELPDGRTVPFPADELLETLRRKLG
jgi:Uma2 family endonuclease